MKKGLLIWNVALTIIVIGGLITGFLVQRNYHSRVSEEITVIAQHLKEMNAVLTEHAVVINEHATAININMNDINKDYVTAMEENQRVIEEMNGLIVAYQKVINENTDQIEELLNNLEDLAVYSSF